MAAKWNKAKAAVWLEQFAEDIAEDAYTDGGIEALYSAAGAAYYAVLHGIGYNTRKEFCTFFHDHMKLDKTFWEETLEEIDRIPVEDMKQAGSYLRNKAFW